LTPICTKSFVGCGFAPDPTGEAYSAPPKPVAVIRGPTSKGRGWSSFFALGRKEKLASMGTRFQREVHRPIYVPHR